jgi:hypothetical protein
LSREDKESKKPMKEHHVAIVFIEPLTQSTTKWLLRAGQTTPAERPPSYYVEVEGKEMRVTPNTTAWFDWLDGLSHFDFDGEEGDFMAQKKVPQKPGEASHWVASRQWGGRSFQRDLGETSQLSMAHLEEIARDFEEAITPDDAGGTGEGDLRIPYVPTHWKRREGRRQWKYFRRRTYRCSINDQ